MHLLTSAKPAALKNIVFMCLVFGLICLSIEIANKTYVVASKKTAKLSWDKFFNNNEVNKPPQDTYLNLTKPELESIRWHLNESNDVTTEQLKILMQIFNGSDDSILHLIAENPNIDREIAETLLKKPFRKGFTYYVGDRIARNRNTPPDILVRLLELPDDDIKAAVARNESTPRNVLIEMNRPDADKTIQRLKERDYAHKLVKEIKNDLRKNNFNNAKAKFDLVQKLYIDSPNTLVELGKLSVNFSSVRLRTCM